MSDAGTLRSTKKFLRTVKRRVDLTGQRVGTGDAAGGDAVFREGRRRLEGDAGLAVLAGDDDGVPVGRLDEPLAGLPLWLVESSVAEDSPQSPAMFEETVAHCRAPLPTGLCWLRQSTALPYALAGVDRAGFLSHHRVCLSSEIATLCRSSVGSRLAHPRRGAFHHLEYRR